MHHVWPLLMAFIYILFLYAISEVDVGCTSGGIILLHPAGAYRTKSPICDDATLQWPRYMDANSVNFIGIIDKTKLDHFQRKDGHSLWQLLLDIVSGYNNPKPYTSMIREKSIWLFSLFQLLVWYIWYWWKLNEKVS